MQITKGFKYRLYPNKEQQRQIMNTAFQNLKTLQNLINLLLGVTKVAL